MLKHSKKTLLLAAAMLVPGISLAQEKPEVPAKVTKPVEEATTEEVIVEKIEIGEEVEVVADDKKVKKTAKVVDAEKPRDSDEETEEASFQIRLIEMEDDNVPQNLRLILKNLKVLEGSAQAADGNPKVMTFTLNEDGALKGKATEIELKEIDKKVKEAMKSIDVSIDAADGQVFRILQNMKPLEGQMKALNGKSIQLKNLTEAMSDMNMKGTISISSSSSSSSSDGKDPKVVTNSQIRIIGPDGKVQELSFDADGLNQESLSKAVEEALKKSGKDLPEDVRKRVEAAVERAGQRSNKAFGQRTVIGRDAAKAAQANSAKVAQMMKEMEQRRSKASNGSVEKKLDLILNRLEKMQQEIDELRKK